MTALDTDVALVGLGIHGSAAAYELAARGVGVIAVDQFADGHCRGSSHGRTRMIRRAYPSPAWNDFVARAYDGWERWSAASGQALLRRTGGLYAHRGAAQLQGPGCELVESPERMREVMPSLAVPAGYRAVYDPEAGVLDAAAALTGARAGARAAGAELVFGERMLSWTATDHGVSVVTTHRTIRAGRVLAVGARACGSCPGWPVRGLADRDRHPAPGAAGDDAARPRRILGGPGRRAPVRRSRRRGQRLQVRHRRGPGVGPVRAAGS